MALPFTGQARQRNDLMKYYFFPSCLVALPLIALAGCSGEQPQSTTTTSSEESTVSQPAPTSTTTETTVQKN